MSVKPHDPADTQIASEFTIRDYEAARDAQPPDAAAIAEAIHRRFTDRYIAPVSSKPKHGFTMMAVACLMIEALESFRQGWVHTKGMSEKAFTSFFKSAEPFGIFEKHAGAFYKHVRCGILHQAETTGGWRIRRDGSPLLDEASRTVNAERFVEELSIYLRTFCDHLVEADWAGPEWANVRLKMDAICQNARDRG